MKRRRHTLLRFEAAEVDAMDADELGERLLDLLFEQADRDHVSVLQAVDALQQAIWSAALAVALAVDGWARLN